MEIQTSERYRGIPFDNPKQAFNAILLYLADFHKNARYVGPELFVSWDKLDFLGYDLFRLRKFIEKLETTGESYGNYGSHIGSQISSLQLQIITSPNKKSVLSFFPNLDNNEDYEGRIIELLNEPSAKEILEPHFGSREYKRIQESARITIKGTQEELDHATNVLQIKMGFNKTTSRMGSYWEREFQQFTLPSSEIQENALAITYEVEVYTSDIFNGIETSFEHPKSYKHAYYEGPHLTHARDTFKKTLEDRLQK